MITWLKKNGNVVGTIRTVQTRMRPASVAVPLQGRVVPVPKNLLLPAFSTPTVVRDVIGFRVTIRRVFLSAAVAMDFVSARGTFR